jgi:cell division protein FtsI/penicillin-binding protein 2
MAKIYAMHNQDRLEPSEPGDKVIFMRRTTAASEVYKEMSVDERVAVDRKAEVGAQEPIASEVQQKCVYAAYVRHYPYLTALGEREEWPASRSRTMPTSYGQIWVFTP